MKTVMTGMAAAWLLILGQSCTNEPARYVDVNTGTPFELVKHPQTGLMVDAQTGKPLNIYVDRLTRDTIDGRTGKIINGKLEKIDNSFYVSMELHESMPAMAGGTQASAPHTHIYAKQ